jgi:hypothetical protein
VVEGNGADGELLIAVRLAIGGAPVIADDAQHMRRVRRVSREGAELFRHLRRGGVGRAGHDRGDGAAQRSAGFAVVGKAGRHQQATDIGEAESQRTVVIAALRDLRTRVLGHQHRDLERDGP